MEQNHAASDLELIAQQLDQSEDYQVLRRFQPVSCYRPDRGETLHKVCIIDTETTGLDTERCEIIELGYQILSFDSHGQFYEVLCAKNFLNEPKGVITPEVTQVTGLTIDDVKGHQIPWDEVVADMQEVQLIVAHNAGFDR
ncbi:MAG: 3'-5' exonuclease, partial [Thiotrichales bacterium]|nr:3'-5' exonuclease [Thiotrichales bacterium]